MFYFKKRRRIEDFGKITFEISSETSLKHILKTKPTFSPFLAEAGLGRFEAGLENEKNAFCLLSS